MISYTSSTSMLNAKWLNTQNQQDLIAIDQNI